MSSINIATPHII